jgi:hypothetical protein
MTTALLNFAEVKDDNHIIFYKQNNEHEEGLSISSKSFYEEIYERTSDDLVERILKEYEKSREEFDDYLAPPDIESFRKSLQLLKGINGYKSFIQSICALGNGGFNFRFQINESEYIDIGIYNRKNNIVLHHSMEGENGKPIELALQEAIVQLKKILGIKASNFETDKNKSKQKFKEALLSLKGNVHWEGDLYEMRKSRHDSC